MSLYNLWGVFYHATRIHDNINPSLTLYNPWILLIPVWSYINPWRVFYNSTRIHDKFSVWSSIILGEYFYHATRIHDDNNPSLRECFVMQQRYAIILIPVWPYIILGDWDCSSALSSWWHLRDTRGQLLWGRDRGQPGSASARWFPEGPRRGHGI